MLLRISIVLVMLALASPAEAVVGGHETAPAAWPFASALIEHGAPDARSGQFCGAVLIAPNLALTAAHCVTRAGSASVVRRRLDLLAGQHLLSASRRGRAEVVEVRVHPGYSPKTFAWDAALLRLSRRLDVPAARLPDASEVLAVETPLIALGWGATNAAGSSFPDALQEASLTAQPDATCRSVYGSDLDSSSTLCAGIESGGVDTCDGDSGGPLMLTGTGGTESDAGATLVGITSFGGACGAADTPGGYTKVAALVPWLAAKAPTSRVRTLRGAATHLAVARKRH